MQLGIDFNGTIVRFLVVVKSGACDGIIHGKPFEILDAAKKGAKCVLKRSPAADTRVRIVEQRISYKKVWESEK